MSTIDHDAALASGLPPAEAGRPVECHDCGLRHVLRAAPAGNAARCRRCGARLRVFRNDPLNRALALTFTGLILMAVANLLPFMSLSIEGRVQNASLLTGAKELFDRGLWVLAGVVILTTIVAPLIKLGGLAYVLLALRLLRPPRHLPTLFRRLERVSPWAMIEVYLLGVFVAYVKLVDLATIDLGAALYSLAALMVLVAVVDFTIDSEDVWEEMERRGLGVAPAPAAGVPRVLCEDCGLLAPLLGRHARCPRCGARLHRRQPDSLARTWALVIAAMILYVPANVYPVMTVISFGRGAPDTILSGVKELFGAGMWPLALLVFFASITVPVLKLLGLMVLLVATQRRSAWRLRDRTVLYRIVETIGRWSMIDIFMLSILVGLVRIGSIATIEPGVGATSFASVVILTMFAATAFDPRLMWDAAGANHE
jgi:paraquat-inducible protein A